MGFKSRENSVHGDPQTVATGESNEWRRGESATLLVQLQGMREKLNPDTYEAAWIAAEFHVEHGLIEMEFTPVAAFWRLLSMLDSKAIWPTIEQPIKNYSAVDEAKRDRHALEFAHKYITYRIGQTREGISPSVELAQALNNVRTALRDQDGDTLKKALPLAMQSATSKNERLLLYQNFIAWVRKWPKQEIEEASESDQARVSGWQKLRGLVWGRFYEKLCARFTIRQIAQVILDADQGFKYLPRPCRLFVGAIRDNDDLSDEINKQVKLDLISERLKELRKAHRKYQQLPKIAVERALSDLKRISRLLGFATIKNERTESQDHIPSDLERIFAHIESDVEGAIRREGLEAFASHFFETIDRYITKWATKRTWERIDESYAIMQSSRQRDDLRGRPDEVKELVKAMRQYRKVTRQTRPSIETEVLWRIRYYGDVYTAAVDALEKGHRFRPEAFRLWTRHRSAKDSIDDDELITAISRAAFEFIWLGQPNEAEIADLFRWDSGSDTEMK